MSEFKVTVLKREFYQDLADEHLRADKPEAKVPCPHYTDGQEFILGDDPFRQPADFGCGWAWNSLQQFIAILVMGGDYSTFSMKNENCIIACCPDGIRPVVFKLEQTGN